MRPPCRSALLLGALLGGCPEPSITSPDGAMRDLRQSPNVGITFRGGDISAVLPAEVKLRDGERWREWKRDPSYRLAGAEQWLYFAGSPAPLNNNAERWAIGRAVAPAGQPLDMRAAHYQLLFAGRPGFWDSGDLLSPTALSGYAGAGNRTAIWYAASGDPRRPDYVFQIGLATSVDGQNWKRLMEPVLAAPTFTSNDSDGQPTEMGPTSHGLLDPEVVPQRGSTVWLYFTGVSCADLCRFQILRAVSANGVDFQPPQVVWRGRDGVAEEAGGVAGPSVLQHEGRFYLAYTQVRAPAERSRAGIRRALISGTLALAVSSDGIHFEGASGTLVRNEGFYAGGSFGPSLHEEGGRLQLYFGALAALETPSFSIGRADLIRQ